MVYFKALNAYLKKKNLIEKFIPILLPSQFFDNSNFRYFSDNTTLKNKIKEILKKERKP